jgi:drug/metabolite transporter (DMT)-like permease
MTTIAMIAVILSALFHASYNMLIKTSDEKTIFMWSIFAVAVICGWLVGLLAVPGFLDFDPSVLLIAALSAVFFTSYHLAAARAYAADDGDLSLSYPMTTLAPVFIPLWAYLILDDRLTILMIAGIIVTTAGTFCIQLKPDIGRKFKSIGLKSEAIRFSLLASFLYSFGGISDKVGVNHGGFYFFTVCLMTLNFTYFSLVILSNRHLRTHTLHCFRMYPLRVLAGGALVYFSNITFRFALATTDVSYAAGVRQVATLFAVIMGVFLLKEPYGLLRFFASLVIALGIALIKIG